MTLHSLKMVSVGALVRVAKATATLLVTDKKGARKPLSHSINPSVLERPTM